MDQSVKDEIMELHRSGLSVRGISLRLQIPKSSVQDIISNSATKKDENGDDGKDISDNSEHTEGPELPSLIPRAKQVDLDDKGRKAVSDAIAFEAESRRRLLEGYEEAKVLERQAAAAERLYKVKEQELKLIVAQAKISGNDDGKTMLVVESLRDQISELRTASDKREREYERKLHELEIVALKSEIISIKEIMSSNRDGKSEMDVISQGIDRFTSAADEWGKNIFALIQSRDPRWQQQYKPDRRSLEERAVLIGQMNDKLAEHGQKVQLLKSRGFTDSEVEVILESHATPGTVMITPVPPAQPQPSASEQYQKEHEFFERLMALGIDRALVSQICDRGQAAVNRRAIIEQHVPADVMENIKNEAQALFEPFLPPATSPSRGNL